MKKLFPLLLLFSSLLACAAAQAAILTVNSAADAANQSGVCALRDAIASVNDGINYAGGCAAQSTGLLGSSDAIVFDSTVFNGAHTIHVANGGEIEIQKDLVITGVMDASGAPLLTLDAQPAGGGAAANRIFNVPGGVRLDITGVKFVNGNANSGNGGAVGVTAGGHTLSLTRCAFEGNKASHGGAVWANTANIANSTFSGNSAHFYGGAVFTSSTANIANSTFSDNSAHFYGGAVFTSSTANIANSTFSGNSAHFYGGAVWAYTLHARHLTLLNNTAGGSGQAVYVYYSSSTLHNSIFIGGNENAQCAATGDGITGSHNLEGYAIGNEWYVSTSPTCGASDPVDGDGYAFLNDIIENALAANGGPTPTLKLPTGSPAIGAADPNNGTSQMLDATGEWVDATLDQRGYPRATYPGERSVGAYEWKQGSTPAPIPTLPVPLLLALVMLAGTAAAWQRRRHPQKRG